MPNSDYYGYGVDGSHPYFNQPDPPDDSDFPDEYDSEFEPDDYMGVRDRCRRLLEKTRKHAD